MLTVNDAAITGGTVTDNGTLDLTGTAVLKNGNLGNAGQINVSGTGNELYNETVTANAARLLVSAGSALVAARRLDLGVTASSSESPAATACTPR